MEKSLDVNSKQDKLEFERIAKAFGQMGNLLDLLYLETSVLIETLSKKELINTEEFTKALEETAKKVEESINKAAKEESASLQEEPKKL